MKIGDCMKRLMKMRNCTKRLIKFEDYEKADEI